MNLDTSGVFGPSLIIETSGVEPPDDDGVSRNVTSELITILRIDVTYTL